MANALLLSQVSRTHSAGSKCETAIWGRWVHRSGRIRTQQLV